jgi:hypothetical protein
MMGGAKAVDCTRAAMAVMGRADVEMAHDEAGLPRLRHPDHIANHNILVALISSVLAEESVVHHFPRFSLRLVTIRICAFTNYMDNAIAYNV